MRVQIIILFLILALFISCKPTAEVPKNTNLTNTTNAVNKNTNAAPQTTTLVTTKTPEAIKTNDSENLKPIVLAFYEALKKKDDDGLRKIYSAETLKTFEADMKAEKQKSLAAYISEFDPAPAQPFEVRNEEIKGESAVVEIKGGTYVNWTKIILVKENGAWKMTDKSPDFDSVKSAADAK